MTCVADAVIITSMPQPKGDTPTTRPLGPPRTQTHLYLTAEVRYKLKILAAVMGCSMSQAATYLIEEAMAIRAQAGLANVVATTDQIIEKIRSQK